PLRAFSRFVEQWTSPARRAPVPPHQVPNRSVTRRSPRGRRPAISALHIYATSGAGTGLPVYRRNGKAKSAAGGRRSSPVSLGRSTFQCFEGGVPVGPRRDAQFWGRSVDMGNILSLNL